MKAGAIWTTVLLAGACALVLSGAMQNPLDLPSGGGGGEDEEESAPETIVFYGAEFEGDAFCWSLDKSGSMMWDGRWPALQEELSTAVNSLSNLADFGILFWSDGSPIAWEHRMKRATPANKSAALAFAAGIYPSGGTCVGVGVVRSLELNRTSTRRDKVVILLSDGEPFCGGVNTAAQARDEINAANWDSQKISTIGVNTGTNGSLFLQQVANENGGTYTESN